jgi:DNA repair protein SbcD/Mre11
VRFLHTADWHVGKTIRGRSRLDETAAALDEIIAIAGDEDVDAVLVAGDIYDQRAAAPEADAIVFETLVRLHAARIPAVVIPGNHDSALRLEALGKLLAQIDVTVAARVAPPEHGGIVELPSRDGGEAAFVACVPFVPERRFGDAAALFDASETWYQSYAHGMGELLGAMAAGFRLDRINIVLAHLFTDGAVVGGGERELTIGMAYAIPPGRLPATASYVALGHVHKPQAVRAAPAPTRFAGSPLQLDFGERDQAKSVTIVDASPGLPAKVHEIGLSSGRRLIDLRGSLDEVVARARDVGDAFLRVFVSTDGPIPGIAERVREDLPNALDVHLVYERTDDRRPAGAPVSSLAPREQFLAYLRAQHGAEPDDALVDAFDEVLAAETEGR